MNAEVVERRFYARAARPEEVDRPAATSMIQAEHFGLLYGAGELTALATLHLSGDAIDLRWLLGEDVLKDPVVPQRIQCVWRRPIISQPTISATFTEVFPVGTTYVLRVEVSEENIAHTEFSMANISDRAIASLQAEPEPSMWRGVFSPPHQKKVLFSQEVNIRTAELPRRKPHIAINLRRLEREDD